MALLHRLQKELIDINKNPNKYFSVSVENDMKKWKATILGPEDTPYSNQIYHLDIIIPNNYPFAAPLVKFVQPCYHPNVSTRGDICLDRLNKEWTPIQTISSILISIISFLSDPNPNSPLNADAASLYLRDYEKYTKTVKQVYLKANHKKFTSYPSLTIS